MEDPDVAWPAWKFGMKRDALFTTLHEQYNTFQSSIQDPNAFHHDVYEIANEAVSTVEFHNLLAVRRDQRLRELNESLESASFEIIANPALIGTKQWEHALQLFRTRSLDSLVRYFASYLPPTHPWHTSFEVDNEQIVHVPSSKNTFFDNGVFTEEPMELSKPVSHIILRNELPPSPRSLTTYSDDMDSLEAHELYCLNTLTPARTLSLSDSDDFNGSDHPKNGDATDEQVVNRSADAGSDPVNNKCFLQHDDDSWQLICPDTSAPQIYAETKVADADSIIALDRDTASPSEETPNNPGLKLLTPMISSTNTSNGHADVNADNSSTTATTDITTTTQPLRRSSSRRSSSRRSSSRRRPLQSGYAVDDADRSYSPLPVSVRIRHRSVSPSRPWPLMHVEHGHCHHAATSGIIASCSVSGRANERPLRLGRRFRRLETAAIAAIARSASSSGLGRRRREHRLDRAILPRSLRNRRRQRCEAAASSAVNSQR